MQMSAATGLPLPADERLSAMLCQNALLAECIRRVGQLDLPSWYLGAGCVTQTVWNVLCNRPPDVDIIDYDLVYFDANDSSPAAEKAVERVAQELVADLPITLDVTNQARVHLWYPQSFGYEIDPYSSTEDAISTWPSTATAIGIRTDGDRMLMVAPFGLGDLFALVVRPNRVQITPAIFDAKAARWQKCWPALNVLSWKDGVGPPGTRRLGAQLDPSE